MRIGRYAISGEQRKEGGQAYVYFSVDPETRDPVAIKVARPSQWSWSRMKTEIRAHGKLEHPNILPILDHGADSSWYAMARAECSLEEFGPFEPPHWMSLRAGLIGVSSAIAHAHRRGFIHRDLSAGNILIFPGGWAVADWGFVVEPRTKRRQTEPLERFGTPEFMAPEMVTDPRTAGPQADAFSIGRLAAWGTGLAQGPVHDADTNVVRWWQLLIDGTTRWDPSHRWTLQDIRAHLRTSPSAQPTDVPTFQAPIVVRRGEICPNCRSDLGADLAQRCLKCHAVLAY